MAAPNFNGNLTAAGKPFFDVTFYGAKGNGVADDTADIQAAINAAQTAGGGIVYFPGPANYLTQQLLVNAPIRFIFGDCTMTAFGNVVGVGAAQVFTSYSTETPHISFYSIEGMATFQAQSNSSPVSIWFDTQNTDAFYLKAAYPGAIQVNGFCQSAVRVTAQACTTVVIEGLTATCSQPISTTLTNAITTTGSQTITVGSTTGMRAGCTVQLDPQNGSAESITCTSVTDATHFVGSPTLTHSAGAICAYAPNMGLNFGTSGTILTNVTVRDTILNNCGNVWLTFKAAQLQSAAGASILFDNVQALNSGGGCIGIANANGGSAHSVLRNCVANMIATPSGSTNGLDGIDVVNCVNVDLENCFVNGGGVGGTVGIAIENINSSQTLTDIRLTGCIVAHTTGTGYALGDTNGGTNSRISAVNCVAKSCGIGTTGIYSTGFNVRANDVQIIGCVVENPSGGTMNYGISEDTTVGSSSFNVYSGNVFTGYSIAGILFNSGSTSGAYNNPGFNTPKQLSVPSGWGGTTGTAYYNPYNQPVMLTVSGGSGITYLEIDGAGTGLTSGTFMLGVNSKFFCNFTTAPTYKMVAR